MNENTSTNIFLKNSKMFAKITSKSISFSVAGSLESTVSFVSGVVVPCCASSTSGVITRYVIPAIGHIPINRLKYQDIQNMVNDLTNRGLSYSTVKKAYEVITGCHRYYRVISGQSFNTTEGIGLPQNIKPDLAEHNYFTFEERQKLEKELSRRYRNGTHVYRYAPIMILLMYTGLRIGEALALTWDDIDFKENLIDINKSTVYIPVDGKHESIVQNSGKTDSSMRVLPMSNKARKALVELLSFLIGSTEIASFNIFSKCSYFKYSHN